MKRVVIFIVLSLMLAGCNVEASPTEESFNTKTLKVLDQLIYAETDNMKNLKENNRIDPSEKTEVDIKASQDHIGYLLSLQERYERQQKEGISQ